MTQKATLKKHERLKSKILLDSLFAEGQSLFSYPFKLIYQIQPYPPIAIGASPSPTQERSYNAKHQPWPLLFSVTVPKKKIKSAPNRNLIKRRVRESYRLNKATLQEQLLQDSKVIVSLMFIYIENEPKDYSVIEKSVIKLIKQLHDKINSNNS